MGHRPAPGTAAMLTLKILNELAEKLPVNSAFYRHASGQRAWASSELALGERYHLVHSDVALGWNLPLAYVQQ